MGITPCYYIEALSERVVAYQALAATNNIPVGGAVETDKYDECELYSCTWSTM